MPVSHLVFHYTGMESCAAALERLCDVTANVSAHYLIDEDGTLYQLVPEDRRAWHAGVAYWRGEGDLNTTSIGIELVNPGHEHGYRPFPIPQIETLNGLALNILSRHAIEPPNILGHSDIAPGRKTDPGELFPWAVLAAAGIGRWPAHGSAPSSNPWEALASIGYAVPGNKEKGGKILKSETGERDVLVAFQRRYLPANITGTLDTATLCRITDVHQALSITD